MTDKLIELGKLAIWILGLSGVAVAIGYAAKPLLRTKKDYSELHQTIGQLLKESAKQNHEAGRMDRIRFLVKRLAKDVLYD